MRRLVLPLLAALLLAVFPARAEEPFPLEMVPEAGDFSEGGSAAGVHLESLFGLEMRVVLARGATSSELTAEGPLLITSAESGARLNTGETRSASIRRDPRGIRINGMVFPLRSIRVETAAGVAAFNGKRYRGYFVLWDNDRGTFDVVNHVPLEEYLRSVVAAEMPKAWPLEALKAQAVAARTYAIFRRQEMTDNYFDLEMSVLDQVYGGVAAEDPRTDEAVASTAGMILMYKNQVARAFFHANCGDRTEEGSEVFRKVNAPYLRSVACQYGRGTPQYSWQLSLRMGEVESALGRAGIHRGRIDSLAVQGYTSTGRVKTLAVRHGRDTDMVDAVQFRLALGATRIRSTRFTIHRQGSMLTFKGIGYGHGVGLCQWGAKGMADDGFDFRKILAKYYPGASVATDLLSSIPE